MAQQSVRRGRENQGFPQCFKHALGDMDQARELPYRPAAAQRRIRGRTDGSIRLRATMILKFSLARKGASTDGLPSFASASPLTRKWQKGTLISSARSNGANVRGSAWPTRSC